MAGVYDCLHKEQEFNISDLVYLGIKNLDIAHTGHAFELNLPPGLKQPPVFNTGSLKPYEKPSRLSRLQGVILHDSKVDQLIEAVIDKRQRKGAVQSHILWVDEAKGLNLAANAFLETHKETVDVVRTLMLALRTVNNRTALQQHSELAPLRPNVTRWSSVYIMVARYVRIHDAVKKVEAVFDLISPAVHHRIEALLADLQIFNSVTVKLKMEYLSLAEVRALFNCVMQRFPSMKPYSKVSANVVHSPVFEAAAVKV
ncbi:Hypothetical protein PHPALM_3369 [Phytophthora palmivora]|uniref:Uncharacterized protein n=1 Tax=Phytophthora palmivora TaxID=4796 RepID=A0A2P4YMJ4_9STRA|nr:Hypothetical protein PHPALM_3369 [Phytophthora palmivora]